MTAMTATTVGFDSGSSGGGGGVMVVSFLFFFVFFGHTNTQQQKKHPNNRNYSKLDILCYSINLRTHELCVELKCEYNYSS